MKYIGVGKYIQQNGGVGSHGHCVIELEGIEGNEIVFENKLVGGVIPKDFIPAIENGVRMGCQQGYLCNYPIIGVKITLVDGSYHEIDSSINDFRIAGKKALLDACSKADMVLLEPYVTMEVSTPSEYIGAVIGDLNRRRAKLNHTDTNVVVASVPVSETFGYATALRSLTQGRASFVSTPLGYEEVPQGIMTTLKKK
jgi:elongation factor G